MKTIQIEGMSCGHCTARVEKALKAIPGVSSVSVDLGKKSATCMTEGVSDETLKEAIEDSGYDVLSIS